MTFQQYRRGLVTYFVCDCRAFNVRPFEHDCAGAYSRFLEKCECVTCRDYRSWHDTHKGVREEGGH